MAKNNKHVSVEQKFESGLVSGFGSGYVMKLQSRRWQGWSYLEVWGSSEDHTAVGGGLSFLPHGPLHRVSSYILTIQHLDSSRVSDRDSNVEASVAFIT